VPVSLTFRKLDFMLLNYSKASKALTGDMQLVPSFRVANMAFIWNTGFNKAVKSTIIQAKYILILILNKLAFLG
jgi:hypothetical protein